MGLPSSLLAPLREALLASDHFDSDQALKALFVDKRIAPWRYSVPQGSTPLARVNALIAYLEKEENDQGESALLLFLCALQDNIPPGTKGWKQVAALLEAMGHKSEPGTDLSGDRDIDIGKPIPSVPLPKPTGPIKNRWALLVGINQYVDPTVPPLRFCVNDVVALEARLKALGYSVVTLRDDSPEPHLRPTKDNIEASLHHMCHSAGQDDLILLHLSCHGKLLDGKPVLITQSTRMNTLAKSALPLAEVEAELRASKARRRVLLLDACHVGVEMGREITDPAFIHNVYELAEGFALLAASTSQQIAQETRGAQHGIFTYHLLEGLDRQADRDGKNFVTVQDLATHTLNALRRWSFEHGGQIQEPTARMEGLGEIILADYREQPPQGAGG